MAPLTRGCTQHSQRNPGRGGDGPAHGDGPLTTANGTSTAQRTREINRMERAHLVGRWRRPRARGDEPRVRAIALDINRSAPRTRGCTAEKPRAGRTPDGGPAHAGMHRTRRIATARTGRPRGRGEEPATSSRKPQPASVAPSSRADAGILLEELWTNPHLTQTATELGDLIAEPKITGECRHNISVRRPRLDDQVATAQAVRFTKDQLLRLAANLNQSRAAALNARERPPRPPATPGAVRRGSRQPCR